MNLIKSIRMKAEANALTRVALAGEIAEEEAYESRGCTLDVPDTDDEMTAAEVEARDIQETEHLEEIPVPHQGQSEAERKKIWLTLPRNARAALRKIHHEFGHAPHKLVRSVLKAAKYPQEWIDKVEHMRCIHCEVTAKPKQRSKVAVPKVDSYEFNKTIAVDVIEIHDAEGTPYLLLNIFCLGTDYQVVGYLLQGIGNPKSRLCAETFSTTWTGPFGWPIDVLCDRGLHNRGHFAKLLGAHGIAPSNTALESPEHLGRCERAGGHWKHIAIPTIQTLKIKGESQMKILAAEINSVVNEMRNKGGFSPAQWVLGRMSRRPGDQMDSDAWADIGVISSQIDPQSAFHLKAKV